MAAVAAAADAAAAAAPPDTVAADGIAAGSKMAAEPMCPACLGVLQSPEAALQAVPEAMLAGLPEAEGNAGSWQTANFGSCNTIADCIR